MYRSHFGLERAPFSLTPDTAFVFSARAHRDALNVLLLATDAGEGFIKITGEVGTGKTLLCRRFLASLTAANAGHKRFRTVYIPNPCLSPRTLLLKIAHELRLRIEPIDSELALLEGLHRAFLRFAKRNEQVVVCLDEAQAMPLQTLESLRLLSNLETEQRKLVQVVLFGQRELDTLLARDDLRQLRSRISFQYRLAAFDLNETIEYLQHRASVAGYGQSAPLFSKSAARLLHRAARGLPRRINILAHKALFAAYGRGALQVAPEHARAAISDAPEPGVITRALQGVLRLFAHLRPRRLELAARLEEGGQP